MNSLFRVLVPTALVVAMLTGCAGSPSTQQSSTPTEESSPTSTPPASPTPSAEPGVLISPEGLGPIEITRPIDPAGLAATLVAWDDTFCGAATPAEDVAAWTPTMPLVDEGHYPYFPEIADYTMDSPVTRITIQSDEFRTAEGLGIGSSIDDLTSEYGSQLATRPFPGIGLTGYVVPGRLGQLVFWVAEPETTVYFVEIVPADVSVTFSFHVGYCA